MLQLTQTEFAETEKNSMMNALHESSEKFPKNTNVIMPHNIELDLAKLEGLARSKSAATSPCLISAIDLYKNYGGRIQLFDFSAPGSPNTNVNYNFPFLKFMARRNDAPQATPAIFVNMYNMGKWGDDGNYNITLPNMDLTTALESGFVAYKMLVEQKADDILSNPIVLEYLTKIYTSLFYFVIRGVPGNMPLSGFTLEAAQFIIAKFFLIHIVQKSEQGINEIARKAVGVSSSLQSLVMYEENLGIDYSKLSKFLYTFGQVFYNGHPTSMGPFALQWTRMYGQGTTFAIEYIPYLLHYLFAANRGCTLGNSSRLHNKQKDLKQLGIDKLYHAVMQGVMR